MNNLRKEYFQKYYQEHKEQIKECTRRYRSKNKDFYRRYYIEYRRKNLEKLRAYQQEYDRKTKRHKLKFETGMCKTMINTLAKNKEYVSTNGHGYIKQDKGQKFFYYILQDNKITYISDKFTDINKCVIHMFAALDDK